MPNKDCAGADMTPGKTITTDVSTGAVTDTRARPVRRIASRLDASTALLSMMFPCIRTEPAKPEVTPADMIRLSRYRTDGRSARSHLNWYLCGSGHAEGKVLAVGRDR